MLFHVANFTILIVIHKLLTLFTFTFFVLRGVLILLLCGYIKAILCTWEFLNRYVAGRK